MHKLSRKKFPRMATAKKKQKQKQSLFADLSRSERRRGVIVTVGLTSMFLVALVVSTSSYFSPDRQTNSVITKLTPLPASPGGESAHREAAIVLETDKRGRCEERSFDNRSGKIVSSRVVDCDARLSDERDIATSDNMSAQRLKSILGAFKK